MIDTLEFMDELKEAFEPLQAERLARLIGRLYKELANTVTKAEFEELRKTVSQLADNIKELSEVQKRTEQTVAELAEAQKKTEKRIAELAEAQERTEEEIRRLSRGLEETRQQLGGLSDTVGYTLENEAFKALPALLKRDYGLIVKGRLKRGYLTDRSGRPIEVNIIGEATKNGKKLSIIGEGKVRLSKKEVDRFIEKRLKRLEPLFKEIFPILVTHMTSEPDVEEYAKKKGIALYYSYDF